MKYPPAAILTSFLISAATCHCEPPSHESLATIERLIGARFSESTTIVAYSHTVGMDDLWLAKVVLSRLDLETLLNRDPFKTGRWKRGDRLPTNKESWWKPKSLTDPLSAQVRLKGGRIANVVYGRDLSREVWVIYFEVFET